MDNEEQNDAAAPWDYAPLCKKDIKIFIFVMIAYIILLVAVCAYSFTGWCMPIDSDKPYTVTPTEQIEASPS